MTTDAPVAFVFNLGAALPLVALLVSAFLGAYVFGVNPRGTANRSVLLVMLAFVLWDLGEIVQRSLAVGTSPDVLLFWARFTCVVLGGLLLGTVPAAVTELLWPLLSASDTRVGLGSLYTLVWSIFIAYAVARYRYLVIEPVTELHTARAPRHRLERGLNYLVLENGRSAAMGAFRDIVSVTPGLCVTGLAPSRVTVRFGLERTPILWITTVTNGGRTVRPNALDFELVHTVVKFLRENPGTAVLLDDLDFLATLAGFDAVARFLKRVTNQASASKGTVIIAAGLGTFPPDQLALLRGSVDRVLEVQDSIATSTPGAEHVLMTINAQDAPVALPLVGARRGLLLTTEHPTKARLRYGDRFEIVWVTDQPEAGTVCVRPKALDTEGRRAVA